MALILPVNEISPQWGEDCFFAENATITGDVIMGNQCSVWYNTVIRGDVHYIRMGHKVNVQDGAILHCTYLQAPLNIGNNVSIGHRAIVHGCTIDDNVLIGMGAIVMDHAYIPSNTLIAAGAIVLENTRCEAGMVYAGIPARPVKKLEPEVFEHNIRRIADNYVMYSGWMKKN
ncbi:MAG: gamma carbonic anhydrase family protein [Saprospiraceae bacterium]|jgi:carbonic anhydrase/acetyltransferase-like protein (isoleucine patch superfamily)|nr:gamma carbonic anhydrase family protein [Candidatus Parvibacillus calidus]MBX2935998.1 gamma carbonic anhydrase family protein [Saprospiraceae bacterium]MBX7179541.1 gamma carbonic anhydrase family protein [Saprospiraceae bacterium]MCB0591322.1 gamma carbonic anhydrase family protein [Saprospiraceae bacterium]MCO5283505.1 gamma carbonic anhydrase family protein [Saprospiraceae bacterium]